MSDEKNQKVTDSLASIITAENIQKYILGTTKSGQPRALYDIIKDFVKPNRKKKKRKNKNKNNSFDLYVKANVAMNNKNIFISHGYFS